MPVPSSFNDITQNRALRDYVGWVWYQRSFYAPKSWQTEKRAVYLRFGSVHYFAAVYLNGRNVVNHTGGHLPFAVDISPLLDYSGKNLLTVAVDNTLTSTTVPQGKVTYYNDTNRYPKGFKEVSLNFDFFNYAGIHRSVYLYALPALHIYDLTVVTGIQDNTTGVIDYSVMFDDKTSGVFDAVSCVLDIYDKTGTTKLASSKGCAGSIRLINATLWWPVHMSAAPGYLHLGRFQLFNGSELIDVYEQRIGVREVQLTASSFLINNRAFYFKGFGKHEDSDVRKQTASAFAPLTPFTLKKMHRALP